MAIKKLLAKPKLRHNLKRLRKDRRIRKHLPFGLILALLLGAFLLGKAQPVPTHPKSLVWAASRDVKVPSDLISFLENSPNCLDSDGKPKTDGVNLWSVIKVSQNRFAKLAYGCSYDLTFYKVAVKQAGKWELIDTKSYFANAFLPKCSAIDTYKIDRAIEPFCLEETGNSRENSNLAQ